MGTLRPTNRWLLVLLALGATLVTWVGVTALYGSLPALPFIALLTPALLAVILGFLAWSTRLRVTRSPRAASWRPLDPLVVARFVVLAKACAVAGALGVGFWGGYLLAVIDDVGLLSVARRDAVASGLGVLLSLAVVVTALMLESACKVPPPDDDDSPSGSQPA